MTSTQKANFRRTKEWKEFSEHVRSVGRDWLTGFRTKSRHLDCHHINPDQYNDLNPENFIPLRASSHDFIEMYQDWSPDVQDYVIERLIQLKQKKIFINDHYGNPKCLMSTPTELIIEEDL